MNLLSLSLFRGGEISYNQVNKGMVRALGIEPRTPAWKAGVLPLNYARVQTNNINLLKGMGQDGILSFGR